MIHPNSINPATTVPTEKIDPEKFFTALTDAIIHTINESTNVTTLHRTKSFHMFLSVFTSYISFSSHKRFVTVYPVAFSIANSAFHA